VAKSLTLSVPIVDGNTTVTSLTFRDGTLGDMRGIRVQQAPLVDDLVLIASRLSGVSLAVLFKLAPADSAEVMAVAADFYAACLATGG
jgi:hypothetical protein